MTDTPGRVLLISATIGEGHNATARALQEAAERAWPGCEVRWADALQVMGPGVGPLFRSIYVFNVERTPWLYDLFYAALWRYRWFADASRRFIGAWCGPRLRSVLRRTEPDLVISTYPLGTAGLDWLRRRGELDLPAAAVVSDFSPHPFWVYSDVDLHYVMSSASLRAMRRAQPDAVGAVSVPPVVEAFRPAEKAGSRRAFGLPEDGLLVLVSCGSLGFGSVERAVDAALAVPEVGRVVVVCGRNEDLRERLASGADPRLAPMGWVRDMAGLTAAADVVVTNAGGATALEALACGRTVAMFEPIAGHGRANAELMADAGLALLCPARSDLADALRRLATEPGALGERERVALEHARAGDFTEQVRRLAHLPRHTGRRVLRGQDSFFVHAGTAEVAQQTGAALLLEEVPPGTTEQDWFEHLSALIAERAPHLPMLHDRLVRRRGRKPLWESVEAVEPAEHVSCRVVRGSGEDAGNPERTGSPEWERAFREFFATRVPTDRPPWQLQLLRDAETGRVALLAKMHHALGDGVAVTSTLVRLLRDDHAQESQAAAARSAPAPKTRRLREIARQAGVVARGLASLASAGTAPSSGFEGPSTLTRRYGWVQLPSAQLRASAREHGVGSSVMLLAVVAEALHRRLARREGAVPGRRLRIMVPRTTRDARDSARASGNHTVALAVDLPVGPMTARERVEAVDQRLAAADGAGQLLASGAVLAAFGKLPDPLHGWVVRRIYQKRFFNAVVSALPGPRRPPRIRGALIAGVLPVLPLADGVGIAVGAISWGEMAGVVITADGRLGSLAEDVAADVRESFEDLAAPSRQGEPA